VRFSILLGLFCLTLPLQSAELWTYWVEPCTQDAASRAGCHTDDAELAKWAVEAWARESQGAIVVSASPGGASARIRFLWAGGAAGLYGETTAVEVDGKIGADIYVLPDIHALGGDIERAGSADKLFRDTVVYLTFVHETGHALGLSHTAKFADIMYSFTYGGDFVAYFNRYRQLLKARSDIPAHSGLSANDREALHWALTH
jgi:hypothetical protein